MIRYQTPYGPIEDQPSPVLEGELRRLLKHVAADRETDQQREYLSQLREELIHRWQSEQADYNPQERHDRDALEVLFGVVHDGDEWVVNTRDVTG